MLHLKLKRSIIWDKFFIQIDQLFWDGVYHLITKSIVYAYYLTHYILKSINTKYS